MGRRSSQWSNTARSFPAFARWAFVILLPMVAFSQNTKVQPDCTVSFTGLTAGGNSAVYNNLPQNNVGSPCTTWVLAYTTSMGTPTISVSIQGAPNNNGAAGTFSTISGGTGTTSPSSSVLLKNSAGNGYYPFMRVHVTTLSAGTLSGTLNGWRDDAGSVNAGSGGGGSGCPGTSGSPCDVQGVTATGAPASEQPLLDGAQDGSGNKIALTLGTVPAAISLSSSGLTQIIAAVSMESIRVTHLSISFNGSTNFQLEYGTGSNCGTGTTAVTGVYQNVLTIALDFDLDPLIIASGKALCINLGSSVTGGGLAKYAQF